jgi:RNA-directed DNA polymerase
MSPSIDELLLQAFTPDKVIETFNRYKESKRDSFTSEVDIPFGVDGVTYKSFENQIQRHAKNICHKICEGTYIFAPFREVEIEKQPAKGNQPAKYRTLSIATIRDVIVQTILYNDVLYARVEKIFSQLDSPAPVSFAYRRGKSAPKAAVLVHSYIRDGYRYIFDADLSKFFDTIPHPPLLTKVANVLDGIDCTTYKLVRRFVLADRTPFETYKAASRKVIRVGSKIFHWRKPIRERRQFGVPQGGVLSGLLANLYLHEFDEWVIHELGQEFDIRYVRYADDFIILSKLQSDLPLIQERVDTKLSEPTLGLKLNLEKTSTPDTYTDGLEFLGFGYDAQHIRVGQKNIERYKRRIRDVIDKVSLEQNITPARRVYKLVNKLTVKIKGYSGEYKCVKCGYPRVEEPRSWIAFFKVATDVEQFRKLDSWTRKQIYDAYHAFSAGRLSNKFLRQELPTLVNELFRVRNYRLQPCVCDILEMGVQRYIDAIYKGKKFQTLATRERFFVQRVVGNSLHIRSNRQDCYIDADILEQYWHALYEGKTLTFAQLRQLEHSNGSQIATLLAQLPGVNFDHLSTNSFTFTSKLHNR